MLIVVHMNIATVPMVACDQCVWCTTNNRVHNNGNLLLECYYRDVIIDITQEMSVTAIVKIYLTAKRVPPGPVSSHKS